MTSNVIVSSATRTTRGSGSSAEPSHVPSGRSSCGRFQQSAQPHDVVRRRGEGEDPPDEPSPSVAQLAQAANRFHPAEALFDELPFLLTDRVAGMPRRARVDRAASTRGVLRDVRCGVHRAEPGDEVARVVAFVGGRP